MSALDFLLTTKSTDPRVKKAQARIRSRLPRMKAEGIALEAVVERYEFHSYDAWVAKWRTELKAFRELETKIGKQVNALRDAAGSLCVLLESPNGRRWYNPRVAPWFRNAFLPRLGRPITNDGHEVFALLEPQQRGRPQAWSVALERDLEKLGIRRQDRRDLLLLLSTAHSIPVKRDNIQVERKRTK